MWTRKRLARACKQQAPSRSHATDLLMPSNTRLLDADKTATKLCLLFFENQHKDYGSIVLNRRKGECRLVDAGELTAMIGYKDTYLTSTRFTA
uniref:Uncharacterized protein n=1 Tax=Ditylenchus dipsaci TaxID=166011 RepID=A0A915DME1_9BILA